MVRLTPNKLHETLGVPLAALVLVAGSVAIGGCSSPKHCHRIESSSYPGDPNATSDRKTWRLGILATLPSPAADVVVGFKNPNDTKDDWHDSHPVSQAQAGKIALKLGNGATRISEYYDAPSDSPICNSEPATTFSPVPLSFDTIQVGAAQPAWP